MRRVSFQHRATVTTRRASRARSTSGAAQGHGAGTIVSRYLANRGIELEHWPASLRFHPRCPRPRDDAGNLVSPLPAMVALVEHVERGPVAVHCTYLRPDGSEKADLPKHKQRACFGPVGGGAVRLGMPRAGERLRSSGRDRDRLERRCGVLNADMGRAYRLVESKI